MGSQEHEATSSEVTLTRRQIAARKRAARTQAAKAWLAGRKGSKTPVADRLMARFLSEFSAEAIAYGHQKLQDCLIDHRQASNYGPACSYQRDALALYHEFAHWKISTPGRRAQDAIDYLKEQGIEVSDQEAESCLRNAALEFGKEWPPVAPETQSATPRGSKPVQLPLIEADEPARANETQVVTPNVGNNNRLAPEMVQKVVTSQKPVTAKPATASMEVTVTPAGAESENAPDDPPPAAPVAVEANLQAVQEAYNAANRACRAILKQRNPRLRAISREKGMLSLEARQAKAAVVAEYAEQLAKYEAELKRTKSLLVRMGHPPYPSATDDLAQEPVSREKCAVDDSGHQANSHQHAAHDDGDYTAPAVIARMFGNLPFSLDRMPVRRVVNPFTHANKKTTYRKQKQGPVRNDQQGSRKRQDKQSDAQQYQHFVPIFQSQVIKQPFQWRPRVLCVGDACRSLHLAFKHTAPPPIPLCRRLDTARYRHQRTPLNATA